MSSDPKTELGADVDPSADCPDPLTLEEAKDKLLRELPAMVDSILAELRAEEREELRAEEREKRIAQELREREERARRERDTTIRITEARSRRSTATNSSDGPQSVPSEPTKNDEVARQFTIESSALKQAFSSVKSADGGGPQRPGFLRVEPTTLTVDWCGAAAKLPCQSTVSFQVQLTALAMRGLAKAAKRQSGTMEVAYASDKLDFGSFSVPCKLVEGDPEESLPVGATAYELITIALTESDEAVDQKGLTQDVGRAWHRLHKTTEQVAGALKWLRIDEARIRSWIEAHVRARAVGDVSFEMTPDNSGTEKKCRP